jgi:hypothetical protein
MGESDLGGRLGQLARDIDDLRQLVKSEGASPNGPSGYERSPRLLELHNFWHGELDSLFQHHSLKHQELFRRFRSMLRDENDLQRLSHDRPSADAYLGLLKAHVEFLLSGHPAMNALESNHAQTTQLSSSTATDRGEALYQEQLLTFAEADHGRYVVIDLKSGGQIIADTIPNAYRAFVAAFGEGARGFLRRIGGQRGDF